MKGDGEDPVAGESKIADLGAAEGIEAGAGFDNAGGLAGAIADEDAAAKGCGLQGEDLIEKDLCFGGGGGEGVLGVGGGEEEGEKETRIGTARGRTGVHQERDSEGKVRAGL